MTKRRFSSYQGSLWRPLRPGPRYCSFQGPGQDTTASKLRALKATGQGPEGYSFQGTGPSSCSELIILLNLQPYNLLTPERLWAQCPFLCADMFRHQHHIPGGYQASGTPLERLPAVKEHHEGQFDLSHQLRRQPISTPTDVRPCSLSFDEGGPAAAFVMDFIINRVRKLHRFPFESFSQGHGLYGRKDDLNLQGLVHQLRGN